MKAEDIKIGEPIWFDDSVQMVDWAKVHNKSAFFLDTFTFPGYKITDIRTHKDEKYLIVATRDAPVEWAVKFSELIDKRLLEKYNPFTVGEEVEPVNLSGDLQVYKIKDGEVTKIHKTTPHPYIVFKIKKIQGDYIQEKVHTSIWFKASDFKKKETMTKQNSKDKFTVEGIARLRKALADELKEEAGFQVCAAISLDGMNYDKYLTPGADKVIGVTNDKAANHYILPGDWDKSLQAFKDYFTPEYKVGDIVVKEWLEDTFYKEIDIFQVSRTEDGELWSEKDSYYRGGKLLDKQERFSNIPCAELSDDRIKLRLATEEEILNYKNLREQEEKITVAGYEMKVKKTLASNGVTDEIKAKFCDQYFTIQELESYKKLLQLQKYICVNIRLGDTTLDLETLDKIISKLK